jgi:hypothetical protein
VIVTRTPKFLQPTIRTQKPNLLSRGFWNFRVLVVAELIDALSSHAYVPRDKPIWKQNGDTGRKPHLPSPLPAAFTQRSLSLAWKQPAYATRRTPAAVIVRPRMGHLVRSGATHAN